MFSWAEKSKIKDINAGFTILELIIAVFLITVGITAALTLIAQITSALSASFPQLTAAYLAQEGVELIRNVRDSNWLVIPSVPPVPWDTGLSVDNKCEPGYNDDCPIYYIIDYDDLVPVEIDPATDDWKRRQLYLVNDVYIHDPTPAAPELASPFKRVIEISYEQIGTSNEYFMEVRSIVIWHAAGKDYEIIAEDHLYEWLPGT